MCDLKKVFFQNWARYVICIYILVTILFCKYNYVNGQLIITNINANATSFGIQNVSNTSVFLGDYVVWDGIRGLVADLTLAPGANAQYIFTTLKNETGELAIYESVKFNQIAGIIDYVRWGDWALTQVSQHAGLAGLWSDADYLPPIPVEVVIDANPYTLLRNFNYAARNGFETNVETWGLALQNDPVNRGCLDWSFEGPVRQLEKVIDGYFDFESETPIQTTQVIKDQSLVDYDSKLEILFNPGFEIHKGAQLEAFIDGCDLGKGGLHPQN